MKNVRLLTIILTLSLLFTMVACNKKEESNDTSVTESNATEKESTTKVPDTDDTTTTTGDDNGDDEPTPDGLKYTWATQGGDGTATNPLIINQNNFVDFYNFYLKGGFDAFIDPNEYFELTSDVVLNQGNAKDWASTDPELVFRAPMNSFKGTFEGNGHTISGLCIKTQDESCGLFFTIDKGAVVKNLRVTNSYLNARGANDGYWNTGTFASRLEGGAVENCYSDAILDSTGIGFSGNAYFGGIVGRINKENCKVIGCVFAGEVNAISARGGGIIGGISTTFFSWAEVKNCLNLGKVVGYNGAGIVGLDESYGATMTNITNCLNLSKDITRRQTNKAGNDLVGAEHAESSTEKLFTINTWVITDVRPDNAGAGGVVYLSDDLNDEAFTLTPMTLSQFLALNGTANAPAGWYFSENCVPCPIQGLEISLAPYLTAWGITLN